jgi:hypothetical protein
VITTSKRTGLLALAVMFSAGIHAALVPEHLREMPPLGYSFIAAAAIGGVLALALVARPDDRRIPPLAGLFCLGQIAAWALFVSVPMPGFSGTPEPIETIALLSKAIESVGVMLAFPLAPACARGVRALRVSTFALIAVVALAVASSAAASSGTPTVPPTAFDDSQLQALTQTEGGVGVVPTTRTIPHWWGATLDPADGITYGYNMVGADPNTCSGAACDVTVQADITPIVLHLDGMTFSGSDVLPALLASPVFALNDYGSTPYATTGDWFTGTRGPGGILSQQDAGIPLQLQDATMRAQFGKTGSSTYHLRLRPKVLPAVTIDVPSGMGMLLRSGRGVVFAFLDGFWWLAQEQRLEASADPTHLALYVSDDTVWGRFGPNGWCCAIGNHSAMAVGYDEIGSGHSSGNAPVQTFAWATWLSPGLFARPDGGRWWALQDMDVFSHEVAEWADDPFASNTTQPWPFVPPAPQYGCSNFLEVGDPAGNAGFAMGANTFRQGPNPNGTQSADGYYHPEDEVTLPWFMRLAPNLVSEPTQTPTGNVGRYTLMGSLDTYAGLTGPAPTCP